MSEVTAQKDLVAGVYWIAVNCPQCGNVNRAARRRCNNCTNGKVMKSVPMQKDNG